ncbi:nuclear transport factor 2 family protein [Streptomyces sp. NPDC051582]|uniref:nuclear transport factor 2 family protein n=1 Tax=Streptomyces sp. NPDC051582 TaxID=3155167 RepID=UPI00343AE865
MSGEMKELVSLPVDTVEAQLVERQIDAYNSQSLDDFMDCYADQAELLIDGVPAVTGQEALRGMYAQQFATKPARATVLGRIVQGELVIDQERVVVDGDAATVVAIYRIRDGLIQQVNFVGQQVER